MQALTPNSRAVPHNKNVAHSFPASSRQRSTRLNCSAVLQAKQPIRNINELQSGVLQEISSQSSAELQLQLRDVKVC